MVTIIFEGDRYMNIPNVLTLLRIFLIPIYLFIFFSNMENRILLAGLIVILAGISDVTDGYIARKYDLETKLGAILDPFADKMMTFAVLISYTYSRLIPAWILIAMGIKELTMMIGGAILYLFRGNKVLPSNKYGKIATVSFYIATLSVIFHLDHFITMSLFFITVVLNILAFINYFFIYLSMRNDTIA